METATLTCGNGFTLSLTYAIPGRTGFGQMLEGWELNSIVTLRSPQPWGPIDLVPTPPALVRCR